MRATLPSLIVITALSSACGATMRLQVLQPALVDTPANVRTIAVVDRSRAGSTGEKVLGALESIVTGEGIAADNFGRSRAVTGAVDGLRASPRFDGVMPYTPPKEMETSLRDRELSWETATRICREAGCQAIIALETFDSNSDLDVTTRMERRKDANGNEVERPVFDARRRTTVRTTWRYYDVVNRQVLDSVRDYDTIHTFTESDPARDRAVSLLPPQRDGVGFVGDMAGRAYARRIAPTYVWVDRSYYTHGDDLLKLGKRHARAGDWDGAAQHWDALYRQAAKPRHRGRAAYNLALASEVRGDLQVASEWATEAAILLGNGKSRTYQAVLSRRRADEARLEQQMKVEEPGQVGPARPPGPPPPPPRPTRTGDRER